MKYIAFDIGDVLCYCDEEKFLNSVSETANITYVEALRFFQRFWELHDLGFTTIQDELQDKLGIKSEIILKKLTNAWLDTLKPNDQMINFLTKLMFTTENLDIRTDVQIALLSNIGKEHSIILEDKFTQEVWHSCKLLDNCIKYFSCDVGARKPSFIYYQSFLSMHPEFKGCVYVDDRKENLIAGEKMGFKPFHFSLKEYYEHNHLSYGGNLRNNFNNKLNELSKFIG